MLQVAGADVKRILVTRLVGNTYYARILLSLPGGVQRSVDARPSDSIALALQCAAPVFVAKQIARYARPECRSIGHTQIPGDMNDRPCNACRGAAGSKSDLIGA